MTDAATVIPFKPRAAPPAPEEAFDTLDLRESLRILRRRAPLIGALVVAGIAWALLALLFITPQYRAETIVMLNARQTHVVDIGAVMSGLPVDNATLRSEIDIIGSRAVIDRVIDKLHLAEDPEFNRASWFAWLSSRTPQEQAERRRSETAREIGARLHVDNDGRSFSIRISFDSRDAKKAARIANTFADEYLVDQLEAKYEAATRANSWLSERLEALKRQVEVSEKAVEDFRQKANLIEIDGATVAAGQLEAVNNQLAAARAATAEAEAREQSANDMLKAGGIDAAADVLSSPLIQRLREQEAEVRRNAAELATRYGDMHPKMINARAEMRDLEAKIAEEVQKIIHGFANEADIARAKEKELEKQLLDLQQRAGDQLKDTVVLRQLEREAAANRSLYESFLTRFKQTGAQEDLPNADSRIIAHAEPPLKPGYPLPWLFLLLGALAGGIFGIGAAYLVEYFDRGFRGLPQIEAATGLPAIGLIPALDRKHPEIYVMEKPLSAFSESLRTVRAAVQFSNIDHPPRSLTITSALPGEGKTTFGVCLARALARAGNKILLIDADLRRPAVAGLLGRAEAEGSKGLVALLAGQITLEEAIEHDSHTPGPDFIRAQGPAPNAQDLLGSRQMEKLIREASALYDLVIVDTPPILAVSDAVMVSRATDTAVFITRWAERRATPYSARSSSWPQGTGAWRAWC